MNTTTTKMKPEVAELFERAKSAQKKYEESPELFVGEDMPDEHSALVKAHCPESLRKKPEWECVFARAGERLEGYASRGYFPVVDDTGSLVVDHGGNPMLKIKKSLRDARKEMPRKESRRRMGVLTQHVEKQHDLPAGSLQQEQLSITKNE